MAPIVVPIPHYQGTAPPVKVKVVAPPATPAPKAAPAPAPKK